MADLNTQQNSSENLEFDLDGALLAWEAPEFPIYERNWRWWGLAGAVTAGLLIYAAVSGNFTFALVIVMAAVLLYMRTAVAPENVMVALMPEGLVYGKSFYAYKSFRSFWICYQPPSVQSLYLEFYRGINPRLTISIADMDPELVRQVVGSFIKEEPEQIGEPTADLITRLLKL